MAIATANLLLLGAAPVDGGVESRDAEPSEIFLRVIVTDPRPTTKSELAQLENLAGLSAEAHGLNVDLSGRAKRGLVLHVTRRPVDNDDIVYFIRYAPAEVEQDGEERLTEFCSVELRAVYTSEDSFEFFASDDISAAVAAFVHRLESEGWTRMRSCPSEQPARSPLPNAIVSAKRLRTVRMVGGTTAHRGMRIETDVIPFIVKMNEPRAATSAVREFLADGQLIQGTLIENTPAAVYLVIVPVSLCGNGTVLWNRSPAIGRGDSSFTAEKAKALIATGAGAKLDCANVQSAGWKSKSLEDLAEQYRENPEALAGP